MKYRICRNAARFLAHMAGLGLVSFTWGCQSQLAFRATAGKSSVIAIAEDTESSLTDELRGPVERATQPSIASATSDTANGSAPSLVDQADNRVMQPIQHVVAKRVENAADDKVAPLLIMPDEDESTPVAQAVPAPIDDPLPVAADESPLPPSAQPDADRYQIDMATALKLAGANNLQIEIAAERIHEAYAKLDGAKALWIPSLNAGVGYNKHDGRIQATEGEVLEVSRNSLFTGGGALLSGAPLNGGSGGPARFFVDISPVDILFEPLAARQLADASHADHCITFNDTLMRVAASYLELQRGQWQVAIAGEAVKNAEELLHLTENFAKQGAGPEADAARARAELADRQRQQLEAEERVAVVSAELARQLRLDPQVTLFAVEPVPTPVVIVDGNLALEELVAQALGARPELSRHQALVAETVERMRQEKWRPWVPNIHLGASGGGFGGGEGSHLGDFSGRSDFDALAVWELRNLGFGNRALQRQQESRHRQAYLAYEQTMERIAAEVAQAYRQTTSRRQQIEQARIQVESASKALPLNFAGIRGRELRAIEAQQAIAALATARDRYLRAVIDHNRAQFQLLRSLGKAPESTEPEALLVPVEEAPAATIIDN